MKYQTEKDKPRTSAVGAKLLAFFIFLLAVGGLFLGLLGQVWGSFSSATLWHLAPETLSGSFMGNIIAIFKDLSANGLGAFTAALDFGGVYAAEYFLHYILIIALVISLIITIVALCSSKSAKRCAYVSAYLTFLAYGALSACCFYQTAIAASELSMLGATFSFLDLFDLPALLIAAVIAFILCLMAIAGRKGIGFLRALLLLFSAATALAFFYPAAYLPIGEGISTNAGYIFYLSMRGSEGIDIWTKIFVAMAGLLVALNLLLSALRISAKKAPVFDLICYILQLLVLIAVTFIFLFDPLAEGLGFGDIAPNLFASIAFIVLLAASFAALAVAVILTVSTISKKHSQKKAPKNVSPEEVYTETVVAPGAPRPIIVTAAPEAAPAPMTEFERSMEALARGVAPQQQQPMAAPPAAQPMYHSEYRPKASAQPAQPAAPQGSSFSYDAAQYTYDPFINSLTPLQKNEFGDLFIAGKYGKLQYLPTYVIGGDNTEFFRKVFIYLGKYRNYVSADLLDKLCAYVAKS